MKVANNIVHGDVPPCSALLQVQAHSLMLLHDQTVRRVKHANEHTGMDARGGAACGASDESLSYILLQDIKTSPDYLAVNALPANLTNESNGMEGMQNAGPIQASVTKPPKSVCWTRVPAGQHSSTIYCWAASDGQASACHYINIESLVILYCSAVCGSWRFLPTIPA